MNMLVLAWAKARHWEHTMFISDDVATKLFESDLPWKLERFREMGFARQLQQVYGSWAMPYGCPKSADSERPMSCCTLEDQMLLIALLWVQRHAFKGRFDRWGAVSLGYRLNDKADEFLYEHWFGCHRRFQRKVMQALEEYGGGFHQGDIAKFFDSLHQDKLFKRLLDHLEDEESIGREAWEQHVLRDCWNGKGQGRGMPQGHAVSGLLANVYLCPFDEDMCTQYGFRNRYFRYVDDMVWVYFAGQRPEHIPDSVASCLAAEHGLDFNMEKAESGTTEDFLCRVVDPELQALAGRTHAVIWPVYCLRRQEFASFQKHRHAFCWRYSERLRHLGVFITPWYLLRKLRSSGTLGDWLRRLFGLGRLSLPQPPPQSDQVAGTAWVDEFRAKNLKWWEEKDRLARELVLLCAGSLTALEETTDPVQKRRWLRRVKFSAFRLGVFYHPEAPKWFRVLLTKPWVVHPHLTARALRHYRAVEILREGLSSTVSLVRAKCAQELGHLADVAAKPGIWNMAEHGGLEIERLAATESLIRMGGYTDGDRDAILRCVQSEKHPYVLKNFLLMLPLAQVSGWAAFAEEAVRRCPHQVVLDALVWAQSRPKENVLSLPDVEPPYTPATRYPDFELYPLYFDASG
jgi:hypothetical protein